MKVLLLNQCFYPDVMATAQHLTDLAVGLAGEGHEVTVVASDRGYDNPSRRFPRRETWNDIKIIRIPSLALGKKTRWRRTLNFASFLINCALRLLLLPRFDVVVAFGAGFAGLDVDFNSLVLLDGEDFVHARKGDHRFLGGEDHRLIDVGLHAGAGE